MRIEGRKVHRFLHQVVHPNSKSALLQALMPFSEHETLSHHSLKS